MVLEGDHDIKKSYEITEKVLLKTFKELKKHNVVLELIILKPNFVLAGKKLFKSTKYKRNCRIYN